MKQSTKEISPYLEALNIDSDQQLSAFIVQLRRYFRELQRTADLWVKATDGAPVDLSAMEENLYRRYGITNQALRHFSEFQRGMDWDRSKTVAICQSLAIVLNSILEGKLDLNGEALQRLHRVDSIIGFIMNFSTDPSARNLRPFDLSGWDRVLCGRYEAARAFNGKRAASGEVPTSEISLSASQQGLLVPLRAHWRIKQQSHRVAGYDPRPIPLLVGPSGSGKTALVRYFAATEKLPMKDFNVGSWLVSGAKAEPQTLVEIGNFLRANERGVLFIDEVDKLYGTSDWLRAIQQEIYALLDGRTDSFPSWDATLGQKLAKDFFIVGAGTWQTRYAGRQQSLGFAATEASDAWAIEVNEQDEIPEELLMRFNADILHLRPLSKTEFGERILSIHDALCMAHPTDNRLEMLTEKAFASGRHNRWLEAYASRMLRSPDYW